MDTWLGGATSEWMGKNHTIHQTDHDLFTGVDHLQIIYIPSYK